jgi:hypothetical protein
MAKTSANELVTEARAVKVELEQLVAGFHLEPVATEESKAAAEVAYEDDRSALEDVRVYPKDGIELGFDPMIGLVD